MAFESEIGLGRGGLLSFTVRNIAFGTVVGIVMGYLAARYISWGSKSDWISSRFQKLAWLALVLLTYGIADVIGGNGFIAAFSFGIVSGNVIEQEEIKRLHSFTELENTLLMMLTFMFFGALMLYPALQYINTSIIIYTLFSLTLIRMLPVFISLFGTKIRPESKLYLGWFGPGGIGSILYVYTVIRLDAMPSQELFFSLVMITIFFSVMAHGISAVPLSAWYAQRIARLNEVGLAQAETE